MAKIISIFVLFLTVLAVSNAAVSTNTQNYTDGPAIIPLRHKNTSLPCPMQWFPPGGIIHNTHRGSAWKIVIENQTKIHENFSIFYTHIVDNTANDFNRGIYKTLQDALDDGAYAPSSAIIKLQNSESFYKENLIFGDFMLQK